MTHNIDNAAHSAQQVTNNTESATSDA